MLRHCAAQSENPIFPHRSKLGTHFSSKSPTQVTHRHTHQVQTRQTASQKVPSCRVLQSAARRASSSPVSVLGLLLSRRRRRRLSPTSPALTRRLTTCVCCCDGAITCPSRSRSLRRRGGQAARAVDRISLCTDHAFRSSRSRLRCRGGGGKRSARGGRRWRGVTSIRQFTSL